MAGLWLPVSKGEEAWFSLDLKPGNYVVICFLPDLLGEGHAHAELDMVQIFTVTEA